MPQDLIVVHPEIRAALDAGAPVVALESAVATHGLPRTPAPSSLPGADARWRPGSPLNLETARLLERIVRSEAAAPATMAVVDGRLRIGLDDADLARLAADEGAAKASSRDLALRMVQGSNAGLTVAGSLEACLCAQGLDGRGAIRVLATGGIGGAHRGWRDTADVSADLGLLARTPVCVVCSGAKSILDVPATLEMLDSLGVPVVGYQTWAFPLFQSAGDGRLRCPSRAESAAEIAGACAVRWRLLRQRGALLVANPPPADAALPLQEVEQAVAMAEQAAAARGARGEAVTPLLLAEVAQRTGGRSLAANVALLASNARLAARIARAWCGKP